VGGADFDSTHSSLGTRPSRLDWAHAWRAWPREGLSALWAGGDEIIPTWEGKSVVVYVCEAK